MSDTQQPPEEDFSDLLHEVRVLTSGAQILSAFLLTVVFGTGYKELEYFQKLEYVALYITTILSLVFFLTPAAQHRVMRPLRDREKFKQSATNWTKRGLMTLPVSLVLATHLVIDVALGHMEANVIAALLGGVIITFWWIVPLLKRRNA